MSNKNEILARAMSAFWSSIAADNPQIKTGDFSPHADMLFTRACTVAMNEWLAKNSPVPTDAELIATFDAVQPPAKLRGAIEGARCCLDECGFLDTDDMADDAVKIAFLSEIENCNHCGGSAIDDDDERRPCSYCNVFGKVKK